MRAMAWALKAKISRLDQAAEMSTRQTDGSQPILVVNDGGRNVGQHGVTVHGIMRGRANVEFAGWCWIGLIAQITDQGAQAEQA